MSLLQIVKDAEERLSKSIDNPKHHQARVNRAAILRQYRANRGNRYTQENPVLSTLAYISRFPDCDGQTLADLLLLGSCGRVFTLRFGMLAIDYVRAYMMHPNWFRQYLRRISKNGR